MIESELIEFTSRLVVTHHGQKVVKKEVVKPVHKFEDIKLLNEDEFDSWQENIDSMKAHL